MRVRTAHIGTPLVIVLAAALLVLGVGTTTLLCPDTANARSLDRCDMAGSCLVGHWSAVDISAAAVTAEVVPRPLAVFAGASVAPSTLLTRAHADQMRLSPLVPPDPRFGRLLI